MVYFEVHIQAFATVTSLRGLYAVRRRSSGNFPPCAVVESGVAMDEKDGVGKDDYMLKLWPGYLG